MNVGLYFGSYNPVHIGHLIIAQTMLETGGLDQVWLVVSPQNPHKQKASLAPAADRLRMCELAAEGNDRIFPSNVEFMLTQPSYTIDTLTHLAAKYKSYRFSILMGMDNLATLQSWKNYEAIVNYYPIFVYPRLGATMPETPYKHVTLVDAPILQLSATDIRARLAAGKSGKYLVPQPALEYILKNGLYGAR